jgi:uncharacterized protein (DUF427 family)
MTQHISTRPSDQRVQVTVGGVLVADSRRAVELHEGSLPVRYYLPTDDVSMQLLTTTDTSSVCPYKGTATYWSVRAGGTLYPDVVWAYPTPIPEAAAIAGLVCFWQGKPGVDIQIADTDLPTDTDTPTGPADPQ